MTIELDPRVKERLREEHLLWLTTVRQDGMPLPTPVWFWWDGATFLIWSQPHALKLRNIARNAQVALNFNTDPTGEIFVVILGEAYEDPNPAPAADRAAFLAKYAEDMAHIGYTPARLDAEFSTLIRVRPTRIRAQF